MPGEQWLHFSMTSSPRPPIGQSSSCGACSSVAPAPTVMPRRSGVATAGASRALLDMAAPRTAAVGRPRVAARSVIGPRA
eukprot:11180985-Lingulodinium_polyedra.AAC.1